MARNPSKWMGLELGGGRYKVATKLGEGGMGFVYKAHDRNLDTDVVIKVPRAEMLLDPQFTERFSRELRSLVNLSHPHIVKIMDVGRQERIPFAVMQYLSGGDLSDRITAGIGDPATLASWLLDVAKALDFVHTKDYVHRDIKPANILFDESGNAYLSDFGVAKVVSDSVRSAESQGLTGTGMVLGTPDYMAPELIMGGEVDGRIDQYALAMTVYEALAGGRAFEAPTPAAMLVAQSTQDPVRLEQRASVGMDLSDVVHRGMSKDPRQRYSTCSEFANAVTVAIAQAEPVASAKLAPSQMPMEDLTGKTSNRTLAASQPAVRLQQSQEPAESARVAAAETDASPNSMVGAGTVPMVPSQAEPLQSVGMREPGGKSPLAAAVSGIVAVPVKADQLLGELVGEDNAILHNFLRVLILGAVLVLTVVISSLFGNGDNSPSEVARVDDVKVPNDSGDPIDGSIAKTVPEPTSKKVSNGNESASSDTPAVANSPDGPINGDDPSKIETDPQKTTTAENVEVLRTEPRYLPAQDLEANGGNGVFWLARRSNMPHERTVVIGFEESKPLPKWYVQQGVRPIRDGAITEGRMWVSIVGRVPYAAQCDEYLSSFLNARGYDAGRDIPRYIGARIRRIEVAPDSTVDGLDWSNAREWSFREWLSLVSQQRSTWATAAQEMVEPQFIDPALAKSLGPLMFKSWKPWATHSQIPLAKPTPPEERAGDEVLVQSAKPDDVEFQLVRLFDFTAEPGKCYRYSIQLALWNPNRPDYWKPTYSGPQIDADFLGNPVAMRAGTYRESPWSSPSNIVQVPTETQVFADKILPPTEALPEKVAVVVAQVLDVPNGRVPVGSFNLRRGAVADGAITVLQEDVVGKQVIIGSGELNTGMVLLDMRGGQKLAAGIKAPAEMLFLDPQGYLFIKNSVTDRSAVTPFRKLKASVVAASLDDDVHELFDQSGRR